MTMGKHMTRTVLGIKLDRGIGGWYGRIGGQAYRFERDDNGSWTTYRPRSAVVLRSTRTIIDAVQMIQAESATHCKHGRLLPGHCDLCAGGK